MLWLLVYIDEECYVLLLVVSIELCFAPKRVFLCLQKRPMPLHSNLRYCAKCIVDGAGDAQIRSHERFCIAAINSVALLDLCHHYPKVKWMASSWGGRPPGVIFLHNACRTAISRTRLSAVPKADEAAGAQFCVIDSMALFSL